MDDVRKSFSKLKKDFKHRLGGRKRGQDGAGANAAEERVSSPAPLLPPGPRSEEGRIIADASQAYSTDPPPHPELVTADEDHLDDPQRKEVNVHEKEISQSHSRPGPDVGVAAGSGPNQEIKPVASPLSLTPIAPKPELDSTWALSPQ